MGVIAPNGIGLEAFKHALKNGVSGIRFHQHLRDLNLSCQVAGYPTVAASLIESRFTLEQRRNINSVMTYGALAAMECWEDAGFSLGTEETAWETGTVFGTGLGGTDTLADRLAPLTREGQSRRMGSSVPEQVMCSGVSAFIGGILGLGNRVSTNSSACATGTEAVVECYRHIRSGFAERMIAGSSECDSPYVVSGFDAMRVTARKGNDSPERASRPLSASASGFVPGAGAGALMLESLESAQARGARIYAEIAGAQVNCGGQRNGGSITAGNAEGVRQCIRATVAESGLLADRDIDYINGHLTATGGDAKEIENLLEGLRLPPEKLPWINSTKSMIGHTLGAAGAIECVATVLQLDGGFVHPSLNCDDVHPRIAAIAGSIPHETLEKPLRAALKTSFGFGDVNACVIFRAPNENSFKGEKHGT
jgi:3-oxoacyl-(acyl-carrier-protein) synthase